MDFTWGVSSAAYQIEGGWDADGKGPSIWDNFTHVPGNIKNNDTGDIACDSYNKVEEDIYLLRALGVKNYRFSLSWPRIFPNGRNNSINTYKLDGVNLKGYNAWSFMDNFEWLNGYDPTFGLHQVDFDNPNRPRTPKRSAVYYAEIIRNNGIPFHLTSLLQGLLPHLNTVTNQHLKKKGLLGVV
uniref:Lactase n=1 Tax=Calidris pygmaea TaxID=425635 RepID=A0A8C3PQ85_9CHAR